MFSNKLEHCDMFSLIMTGMDFPIPPSFWWSTDTIILMITTMDAQGRQEVSFGLLPGGELSEEEEEEDGEVSLEEDDLDSDHVDCDDDGVQSEDC